MELGGKNRVNACEIVKVLVFQVHGDCTERH